MSYDRFLNVVYRSLLLRLRYDRDDPERTRREMDNVLRVQAWWAPWESSPRDALTDDAGRPAPYWWRGDEDASQGFLSAMGVTL